MVEESILRIIQRFVEALTKEGIKTDKVILYGSYTQGSHREDSDIDVAVVSRDFGKDPVDEGMKLFRIAGSIDPRIEPVPVSADEYETGTWIPLIYEIREKGIELSMEQFGL